MGTFGDTGAGRESCCVRPPGTGCHWPGSGDNLCVPALGWIPAGQELQRSSVGQQQEFIPLGVQGVKAAAECVCHTWGHPEDRPGCPQVPPLIEGKAGRGRWRESPWRKWNQNSLQLCLLI